MIKNERYNKCEIRLTSVSGSSLNLFPSCGPEVTVAVIMK